MCKSNFFLRSCTSNSGVLTEYIRVYGSFVTHSSLYKRVLGYLYDSAQDDLHVAISSLEVAADTKRIILFQNSYILDPLSLCAHVTIKGRIRLGELWKLTLVWDQKILADLQLVWNRLFQDLVHLGNLRFLRVAVDTSAFGSLIIFCDASQKAFGCATYIFQSSSAGLIFSKAKVAPW